MTATAAPATTTDRSPTTDRSTTTATPTVAGIRAAIAPVLARLSDTARHREDDRRYAFEEVRELGAFGLLLIGVPIADGGAGGSLRDVVEVVIDLARADSNVAQALRSSHLSAHQIRSRLDVPTRAATLERLLRGELFAGTSNERNGGSSGSVSTRLTRAADGYLLNGVKYYSTGGLYAHWFAGTATDDDGEVVRFSVPVDRPGVELLDDFDAIGQRLTASGSTRFTDVRVTEDEVYRAADLAPANPWLGSFAQLYLAAVEAGIAAAALDDATWFGRERARPIKHSSAATSAEDPYVRRVVGQIGARAFAARSVVLLAAETLDRVVARPEDEIRTAGAAAAVAVAQAQVVAIESALNAAELVFDVGGGTATNREFAFDRHWRNARTVANHNPRDWKLAVAGGHHLTGEEPPTSGLF
jgi:alkylation response protein AidB-like acyl-CoA dehydrogenase